jgi:hypothetical protein
MTCIVSIIPRLPPLVDGIGDYALSLARLIREDLGIATHFIVTDPAWTGQIDDFAVTRLSARTSGELFSVLPTDDATVLLHYEGYGYAMRGCPLWLMNGLKQWRSENNHRRLVTMFHELYATGPPWTSSFWLSPVQKSLMTQLARLSDQWMTSLERYAATVRRLSDNTSARAYSLPVFSSIGEPLSTPPLADRRRRMIVFGTRGRRIEVYRRSSANLNRICERLGITEILDVGRAVKFDFASELDVPVVLLGELPGAEVSCLLLDAVAGVLDYSAAFLGKSTIFAAYCAHRTIPIIANYDDPMPADGLEENRHYWLTDIESDRLNLVAGQLIADNAFAWYRTHNLSIHAKTLAACLNSSRHGQRAASLSTH